MCPFRMYFRIFKIVFCYIPNHTGMELDWEASMSSIVSTLSVQDTVADFVACEECPRDFRGLGVPGHHRIPLTLLRR